MHVFTLVVTCMVSESVPQPWPYLRQTLAPKVPVAQCVPIPSITSGRICVCVCEERAVGPLVSVYGSLHCIGLHTHAEDDKERTPGIY